jgi:putative ABC transport system ATP-binding protein
MTTLVELKNIGRVYESTPPVHALKNVNISIEQGELVTIVGPSGSGKSTLLNVLGLLDSPNYGDYIFDSLNTSELSENEKSALRGRNIGFVFQQFHLLQYKSVLENVSLAGFYANVKRSERIKNAEAAIEKVGLFARKDFLPSHLSGGEKQRVAIARAIAIVPKLLLCDEPTGNLDSKTSGEIVDLLKKLHDEGNTIIIVTHNDEIAKIADHRISVKDGVVSDG